MSGSEAVELVTRLSVRRPGSSTARGLPALSTVQGERGVGARRLAVDEGLAGPRPTGAPTAEAGVRAQAGRPPGHDPAAHRSGAASTVPSASSTLWRSRAARAAPTDGSRCSPTPSAGEDVPARPGPPVRRRVQEVRRYAGRCGSTPTPRRPAARRPRASHSVELHDTLDGGDLRGFMSPTGSATAARRARCVHGAADASVTRARRGSAVTTRWWRWPQRVLDGGSSGSARASDRSWSSTSRSRPSSPRPAPSASSPRRC